MSYSLTAGQGSVTNGVLIVEGVGTYEVVASQNGDNTFNPAPDVSRTFTVAKAPLTVTADDQAISEGDALPSLTLSYSGFRLSDDEAAIDLPPAITTTGTSQSPAGTYPITLEGGSDDTYELNLQEGILTIEAVLSVEPEGVINVYPNPTTGMLTIDGMSYDNLTLTDLSGRQLRQTAGNELELEDLPKAVYVLRLYQGGMVIYQRKIRTK